MSLNRFRAVLKNRIKRVRDVAELEESELKTAPGGRLKISKINGKTRYYVVEGGVTRYSGDKKQIKSLIQKAYNARVRRQALAELKCLEKALNSYPDESFEEVIENTNEERKALINPVIKTDEEYIKQWLAQPYTPKEIGDNIPLIITNRGERVRSKSEKIIADRLYARGAPYKYECPKRNSRYGVIYPDFTILRVKYREVCYLEHYGMMDNPEYAKRMVERNSDYAEDGIIIGKNLFMLFETKEAPLDTQLLDQIIDMILE